jgi:hypothetical protein
MKDKKPAPAPKPSNAPKPKEAPVIPGVTPPPSPNRNC